MTFEVIWSEFAEEQIDRIFEFNIHKTVSYEISAKIIKKILMAPEILRSKPFLGQRELSLKHKPKDYRYIIESHFKIIYHY